jgi:hypothetical protein
LRTKKMLRFSFLTVESEKSDVGGSNFNHTVFLTVFGCMGSCFLLFRRL